MRSLWFSLPLAALALSSCRPAAPLGRWEDEPLPKFPPAAVSPPAPATPSFPANAPELTRATIRGIEFEGVSFDARSHRLAVVDQPQGPGSSFVTAEDVARKHGALAAINGGFFTPEGKPLGLVVADGKRSGSWNSASSLGSGIFSESPSGGMSIARRTSPSSATGARQLIQAGPLLVESGNSVGGLDGSKSAVRSILLTDGRHRWWLGKTSPCTLAALGSALASDSPGDWRVADALNLDGGRSTDLHVSAKVPGGPITRRSVFNRPVRNFLVITAR